MWLQDLPSCSGNVTGSTQSWQPRVPQGVLSFGNGTSPSTEEEEEAADGDEGRYSVVRGRDEMRPLGGERTESTGDRDKPGETGTHRDGETKRWCRDWETHREGQTERQRQTNRNKLRIKDLETQKGTDRRKELEAEADPGRGRQGERK